MVFAVPVLAAALANTLSGTGVNLKEKIVWYMYVKNKEDFHFKTNMCTGMQMYAIMFLISSGLIFFLNTFIMIQPLLFSTCIPLFLVSGIPYLWYVQPLIFADSSQISLQIKIFKTTLHEGLLSNLTCIVLTQIFVFIFNTFLISTFKSENCC